jgi:hypothetical protein
MKNGQYMEEGVEYWYFNDQLHREEGPACIESDVSMSWCRFGDLHREDGPAVEWADGGKEWWVRGLRHREGGPAVIFADGSELVAQLCSL